jgi:phosphatidylglycerol:prolipoprotein diacylglycerol transferase
MRSTLFRIPYEIGGVPLFGFGLLLAVWAVVAAVIITLQVRRHGWGRETTSHLGAMALVAAFIIFLPRFFPGGMPIRGYGLMVLLGVISGIGISAWRTRQVGVNPDVMVSLCMWMLVAGIVGARLFYVLQYWNDDIKQPTFRETILEILNFPGGGLVIYGALLAGAAAFFYYNWRRNLPPLAMADLLAPGVALGIALGRIGCFFNGCCFGGVCDLPWAVQFPRESTSLGYSPPYAYQVRIGQMHGLRLGGVPGDPPAIIEVTPGSAAERAGIAAGDRITTAAGAPVTKSAQVYKVFEKAFASGEPIVLETAGGRQVTIPAAEPPPRSLPVHPTQLYSAVNAALLTCVLWLAYPFRRTDGEVGAVLMILYSAGRFLLEMLRTDEPAQFGTGLTISQNVSIVIFVLGVVLLVAFRSRPPKKAFPPKSTGGGAMEE